MFRKRRPQLGIDLGDATIKLAMIKPGRRPRVEFLTNQPLPQTAISVGTILDPDAIGMIIREQLGFWKGNFDTVVAVSGHFVALRILKLPKMNKDELDTAIRFESMSMLPFPLESSYWDYETYTRQEHLEVLVAAAEKEPVDQVVACLGAAGLTPCAVEPSAIALARSLKIQLGEDIAAVLDLGSILRELTIYRRAVPIFYRSLSGTGGDFYLPTDGELRPALLELLQELRRSFDYIAREQGQEIEKLILVGAGASKALAQTLQSQLGIEVLEGEPFCELEVMEQAESIEQAQFAVSLGLALRGVREE